MLKQIGFCSRSKPLRFGRALTLGYKSIPPNGLLALRWMGRKLSRGIYHRSVIHGKAVYKRKVGRGRPLSVTWGCYSYRDTQRFLWLNNGIAFVRSKKKTPYLNGVVTAPFVNHLMLNRLHRSTMTTRIKEIVYDLRPHRRFSVRIENKHFLYRHSANPSFYVYLPRSKPGRHRDLKSQVQVKHETPTFASSNGKGDILPIIHNPPLIEKIKMSQDTTMSTPVQRSFFRRVLDAALNRIPVRLLMIYDEIINVVPFIDPDTTRMVEWVWARRMQRGLDCCSKIIAVPKDETVAFAKVIEILRPYFKTVYKSDTFFRGLAIDEANDTVHSYVVAEETNSTLNVHLFGDETDVLAMWAAVDALFIRPHSILVDNLIGFSPDGRALGGNKKLLENEQVFPSDAFYPFLEEGVDAFIESYKNSPASVLVLMGQRGTGKSTFLRKLFFALGRENNGLVTSDNASLNPNMVSWVSDKGDNAVVAFEDADNLVSARENGNQQMSAILNLADGVINNNLKMIISTNLSSTNKIDSALIRDGRAYRVLTFRPLTVEEAHAARASIGLPAIEFEGGKDRYLLAEALNYSGNLNIEERTAPTIGFINNGTVAKVEEVA